MGEREVWIRAGAILAAHGEHTQDYVLDQMVDDIGDAVAVKDWHRIAVAVDIIRGIGSPTASC